MQRAIIITGLFALFANSAFAQVSPPPWRPPSVIGKCSIATDGDPIRVPVVVDDRRCLFLLDTGSAYTVLSATTPRDSQQVNEFTKVELQSFKFFDIDCKWINSCLATDLSHIERIYRIKVDGILGMDILSKFVIHLDFDLAEFLLIDGDGLQRPPGTEVKIAADRFGRPCVPISFGSNRAMSFLVDTGRNSCISVCESDFKVLIEDSGVKATGTIERTRNTTGEETVMDQFSCKSASLASHDTKNVVIVPFKESMIGIPYLCRYQITLDFPRKASYWHPSSRFFCRDNGDYRGIQYKSTNDGWRIVAIAVDSAADRSGLKVGDEIVQINSVSGGPAADAFWIKSLTFPNRAAIKTAISREGRKIQIQLQGD